MMKNTALKATALTPASRGPAERPGRSRWWWLLLAFSFAYFGAIAANPTWFSFFGVSHYSVWFVDSYAILASNDALAHGLDPYVPNPFDYFRRPHVYSHWWFTLGKLGLTRQDNGWLGLTLGGLFLLVAWWSLRPRSAGELGWCAAVLCSPPVLLALNRANNDLVVFLLLAPVVPILLLRQRSWRIASVLFVAFATGLKFYPAVASLVLLYGETRAEIRERGLIALLALSIVGVSVAPDLLGAVKVPSPTGILTFGAMNLFETLGCSNLVGLGLSLVVALLVMTFAWRSTLLKDWTISPAERGRWMHFVLGAALLTGCFFTGKNYAYRWVFALWLAPALWPWMTDPLASRGFRRFARVTGILLLFSLWGDALVSSACNLFAQHVPLATLTRWTDLFFRWEQPLSWAFFLCLLFFLTRMLRDLWTTFTTSSSRE